MAIIPSTASEIKGTEKVCSFVPVRYSFVLSDISQSAACSMYNLIDITGYVTCVCALVCAAYM